MNVKTERDYRERIAELEEEVRQLRDMLCPLTIFPGIVTGKVKSRILAMLYKRGGRYISASTLQKMNDPGDASNAIVQHISELRRLLGAKGMAIETMHGVGYSLPIDSAFKLRQYAQDLI